MPEKPSRRIAAALRDDLRRGDYSPGQQRRVARQTFRTDGLVIGRSGVGWFVAEHVEPPRLRRTQLTDAARARPHSIVRVNGWRAGHAEAADLVVTARTPFKRTIVHTADRADVDDLVVTGDQELYELSAERGLSLSHASERTNLPAS